MIDPMITTQAIRQTWASMRSRVAALDQRRRPPQGELEHAGAAAPLGGLAARTPASTRRMSPGVEVGAERALLGDAGAARARSACTAAGARRGQVGALDRRLQRAGEDVVAGAAGHDRAQEAPRRPSPGSAASGGGARPVRDRTCQALDREGGDEVVLGREGAVDAADADAGFGGDGRHRGVQAVAGEDRLGGGDAGARASSRRRARPRGPAWRSCRPVPERPFRYCSRVAPERAFRGPLMSTEPERQHYNLTLAVLALVAGDVRDAAVARRPGAAGRSSTTSHASDERVAWILTAYLLSASVVTPIIGRLGDMSRQGAHARAGVSGGARRRHAGRGAGHLDRGADRRPRHPGRRRRRSSRWPSGSSATSSRASAWPAASALISAILGIGGGAGHRARRVRSSTRSPTTGCSGSRWSSSWSRRSPPCSSCPSRRSRRRAAINWLGAALLSAWLVCAAARRSARRRAGAGRPPARRPHRRRPRRARDLGVRRAAQPRAAGRHARDALPRRLDAPTPPPSCSAPGCTARSSSSPSSSSRRVDRLRLRRVGHRGRPVPGALDGDDAAGRPARRPAGRPASARACR